MKIIETIKKLLKIKTNVPDRDFLEVRIYYIRDYKILSIPTRDLILGFREEYFSKCWLSEAHLTREDAEVELKQKLKEIIKTQCDKDASNEKKSK
jgi:hypothetical protein